MKTSDYQLNTFPALLQKFFLQRMIQQKRMSGQTVNSYRDSFKIYFEFLSRQYGIAASHVDPKHLDRNYIAEFLCYLEKERHNKAITANNRLSAIHSFLSFVAVEAPEYSDIVNRGLSVPYQKQDTVAMDFITKEEFEAMLKVCDTMTSIGSREKLMLLILYNTGIRISELTELHCTDIIDLTIPSRSCIRVMGKGRKERIVPIWKTTASFLSKYMKKQNLNTNEKLFIGKNGEDLTRSGVRFRIDKIVLLAAAKKPSLLEKNISAHTFRHSVAMNLLSANVDLSTIAIWLGHESIETTHKYMVADMEMKRKAMGKVSEPVNTSYRYKASPDILHFLNSL
ncbi:MAG: tyrosine-type recombinase/integrase [Spirochaetia bacterium]|nr:tyrosine-type recombinase/integrase [Spirochaetia bacterium]